MRRKMSLSFPGLAALGLVLASTPDPARGQVNLPDANQSTWGNRLGRSPKNLEVTGGAAFQYTYSGVLRNAAGVPIPGWPAVDFLLEINAPCQNPVQLNASANSDSNGVVTWNATKLDQGGGSCTGAGVARVRIISIGIFKTLNAVTSPDENGSGVIDIIDLGIFQQAFTTGSPAYQGDLNLSGGPPDVADVGFFQEHFTAP